MKCLTSIATTLILTVALTAAAETVPSIPGERDKCPVCGMFVAHYPDFLAQIVFKDGSFVFFCGVKDMMKYFFDLSKYDPSKKTSDVSRIQVTDYRSMNPIDGYQAYYVVGSVVFGPMGQEFFPFSEESSAREFLQANSGKEIVRFYEITPEVFREMLKKY